MMTTDIFPETGDIVNYSLLMARMMYVGTGILRLCVCIQDLLIYDLCGIDETSMSCLI